MRFKRVFPPSPHHVRRCSWTFGFLVLILPTFSHADCDYKTVMSDAERNACISPEQRRESGHKRVSQERPSAPIAQRKLSPEELAYTNLLASYQQRYPIIDQRSPKYVKRIDDEVAARVGILVDSGMSLTTALTQALDEEFTPRPQATLQSDALWKAALGGAFMFLAFWLVVTKLGSECTFCLDHQYNSMSPGFKVDSDPATTWIHLRSDHSVIGMCN